MRKSVLLLLVMSIAVASAGCSGQRPGAPLECAIAGAAIGGAGGIAGGYAADDGDSEEVVMGVGIGAAVGAIAGYAICASMDPPAEAAPPPPAPKAEPVVRKKIVLPGVNFGHDRSDLKPAAQERLDSEVVTVMMEEMELRVRIEGHTDSQGSEQYNQGLSERRAAAVREHLVAKGITAERIELVGYGESRPIASNETEEGRARNRRVEINVLEY